MAALLFLMTGELVLFSWELRIIAPLIAVVWISLTIAQITYMSRARKTDFLSAAHLPTASTV
jgi:hypothetical protein